MTERCCQEDYGGSHYHCANCGGPSGMYGHYRLVDGKDKFVCLPEDQRPAWWANHKYEEQYEEPCCKAWDCCCD